MFEIFSEVRCRLLRYTILTDVTFTHVQKITTRVLKINVRLNVNRNHYELSLTFPIVKCSITIPIANECFRTLARKRRNTFAEGG